MTTKIENQIKQLETYLAQLKAPETDFDTAIEVYKNALKAAETLQKTFDTQQQDLEKWIPSDPSDSSSETTLF